MKLLELTKIAFIALKSNKVRSGLTMLGIIIGIASVIMMLSIGGGAQSLIVGQIASTGSNNIFIEPGAWDPKAGGDMMQQMTEQFEITTLTYDDAIEIEKDPLIELASPFTFGISRVIYRDVDEKITFMGVTPNANKIEEAYPILGRDISDEDIRSISKVAVLGYKIRQDLFGEEDPLGKKIRIKNVNFKIIGVMEERGTQMFQNLDEYIYIPLITAQKLLLGVDSVRQIMVKAISEDVIDEAVENIRLILREQHNIQNPENDLSKDDFKVMSQVETVEMVGQITGILVALLSSIAAIALFVGGIGIMNIMLVSVTERTREIGLRKAVGARNKDILCQFLIEAVVLTLLGGIIGFIVGLSFSFIIALVLSKVLGIVWDFVLPISAVILAFGVAAVVGLVFGIYPARKAANLDPITALRYE